MHDEPIPPIGAIAVPVREHRKVTLWAWVDETDSDTLGITWRLADGYVFNNKARQLHRYVLRLKRTDPFVDHISRDRLDCRRANLRLVDLRENAHNLSPQRGAASPYRGAIKDGDVWVARVHMDGRCHHLGYYADDLEAGKACAQWRAENMPLSTEDPALLEGPPPQRLNGNGTRSHARCLEVERMWKDGASTAEIAEALGVKAVGPLMTWMRDKGYDLPFRYPQRKSR